MHEFSTMQNIAEVILQESRKHNAKKILRVTLKIGELTFLGPDQLRFAFNVLAKGTIMEDAQLIIEKIQPQVKCACGYLGATEYDETRDLHFSVPLLKCPRCGSSVDIVKGRECLVSDIQMEVPD